MTKEEAREQIAEIVLTPLTDEEITSALKSAYPGRDAPKRYASLIGGKTIAITWAFQVADLIIQAQLVKSKKQIEEGQLKSRFKPCPELTLLTDEEIENAYGPGLSADGAPDDVAKAQLTKSLKQIEEGR